jgi:P27 family predicted phage terminase small subunit
MGRRGPPPTPTKFKVLRGNPGKRALNSNEPEPSAVSATGAKCPARLKGDARKEWDRLIGDLQACGVLTVADLTHFENYCFLHGQVRQYERLVTRVGVELATAKGFQGALLKIRAQCRQFAQDLGLTPSSRSQVSRATPPKTAGAGAAQTPQERFFGRRDTGA